MSRRREQRGEGGGEADHAKKAVEDPGNLPAAGQEEDQRASWVQARKPPNHNKTIENKARAHIISKSPSLREVYRGLPYKAAL